MKKETEINVSNLEKATGGYKSYRDENGENAWIHYIPSVDERRWGGVNHADVARTLASSAQVDKSIL